MARLYIGFCAVLIGLRSLTNFAKLFQGDDALMVFGGQILRGGSVVVPAIIVGAFMLATAVAMLARARPALPMLTAYAAYVAFNMLLWSALHGDEFVRVGGMLSSAIDPDRLWWAGVGGMIAYATVALATTALPAWLLYRERPS